MNTCYSIKLSPNPSGFAVNGSALAGLELLYMSSIVPLFHLFYFIIIIFNLCLPNFPSPLCATSTERHKQKECKGRTNRKVDLVVGKKRGRKLTLSISEAIVSKFLQSFLR